MKTTQAIDFFAPLPSIDLSWNHELVQVPLPLPLFPKQEIGHRAFQLDPADRFTFIIMGLAVFIAILIPSINWN